MSRNEPDDEATQVSRLLQAYQHGQRQDLIPMLQGVQERLGYLSPAAVDRIAGQLRLSATDVFGVATFYSQFRFSQPGKYCLKVCQGTACHVRGSGVLLDVLTRRLEIEPGQTGPDRRFSLDRVMCLGSCALAPVLVVNEAVYGRVTQKKLDEVLSAMSETPAAAARGGAALAEGGQPCPTGRT